MTEITLEQVSCAFSHWRKTKRDKQEQIPQSLWDQVTQLRPNYTQKRICETLKLSGSQVKRNTICKNKKVESKDIAFVVTQQADIDEHPSDSFYSTLTVYGPTNRLELTVPLSALSGLLPQLGHLL